MLAVAAIVMAVYGCSQKPAFDQTVKNVETKSFECKEYTSTNLEHYNAGRAYISFFNYYAEGSGNYLGFFYNRTTLAETAPGYFVKNGNCPALPEIKITSPTDNSILNGTITLSADVSNIDNIEEMGFFIGIGQVMCMDADNTAPFTCQVDTTTIANGTYELNAQVNANGKNYYPKQTTTITINN